MEDMGRLRQKLNDNRISLNEDARRKELQEDKLAQRNAFEGASGRARKKNRASTAFTLDTVDKPNLQLIMFPGKLAAAKKSGASVKVAPEAASDADSDLIGGEDDVKEPAIDPSATRPLNILSDLVDLSRGPKTASANPEGALHKSRNRRAAAGSQLLAPPPRRSPSEDRNAGRSSCAGVAWNYFRPTLRLVARRSSKYRDGRSDFPRQCTIHARARMECTPATRTRRRTVALRFRNKTRSRFTTPWKSERPSRYLEERRATRRKVGRNIPCNAGATGTTRVSILAG